VNESDPLKVPPRCVARRGAGRAWWGGDCNTGACFRPMCCSDTRQNAWNEVMCNTLWRNWTRVGGGGWVGLV